VGLDAPQWSLPYTKKRYWDQDLMEVACDRDSKELPTGSADARKTP